MEVEDFGRYLVYCLEKKGKSLSWLLRQPKRAEIEKQIENQFYAKLKWKAK